MRAFFFFLSLSVCSLSVLAQSVSSYRPDERPPAARDGYVLAWHDEFSGTGRPDSLNWTYERGFVRNEELQWYQPENARLSGGLLVIEGRRERVPNPSHDPSSPDWRKRREAAEYTSACLTTRGLRSFGYGRLEIRARIDTASGAWPALWTLGLRGHWPNDGEIDLMEFYRVKGRPTILANAAWGGQQPGVARWDTRRIPLAHFTDRDPAWVRKFHIWRLERNRDSIALYLDGELLNSTSVRTAQNPDGAYPFIQPQYLLLNLALGQNGGDPAGAAFPIRFEVDYVRYYQPK